MVSPVHMAVPGRVGPQPRSPSAADRCRLWIAEPKGDQEFGKLRPIVHRFSIESREALGMLSEACDEMRAQSRWLGEAGKRDLGEPDQENRLNIVLLDELATLVAYAG